MPLISSSALLKRNLELAKTVEYKPGHMASARRIAARLCAPAAKAIYKVIEARTNVPWWVIAVIHQRESSQNFARSLAQGDPWDRVSTRVPKGRGPFKSFEDAAEDALKHCHPYAARWRDWSLGGALTLLTLYNGLGYESYHNMPSPYAWAGTNHYVRGKYTSDGHFDPKAVDMQMGCACLIEAMRQIDPEVQFIGYQDPTVTYTTTTAIGTGAGAVAAGFSWPVVVAAVAAVVVAGFVARIIVRKYRGH